MQTLALTMAILMVFSAAPLGAPQADLSAQSSLDQIMDFLYKDLEVYNTGRTEINKENSKFYIGIENFSTMLEGMASEPMISSSAHSVCLVRVPEGGDVEMIKNDIKKNADPRKWICVGVDPKNVRVESVGNLILLVMDDTYSQTITDRFLSLPKTGTTPSAPVTSKSAYPQIMDYLYKGLETPRIDFTEIKADATKYYFGLDTLAFTDGLAGEPMMRGQAHSLCLIRVPEGSDITKIKADIKANVDPRKWICAGVEPENVYVENVGNLIMLIMDNDNAQTIKDRFLALK